jgi:predicted permease
MIDWSAFVVVALVSIGSAAALVALFAVGLRLLAVDRQRRGIRAAAYACFVLAALGALYGIYLIVPALHPA